MVFSVAPAVNFGDSEASTLIVAPVAARAAPRSATENFPNPAIATGLNLNRNSVATRLTQLTRAGEFEKAERAMRRPANGASKS
jgi:hypothetical protein